MMRESVKHLISLANYSNEKILELWNEKSIEAILKQEKEAIDKIREGEKSVANNLYYTQLLSIIRSIREETYRILLSRK